MGVYLRPTTLEQALAALAAAPLTILAGGTDLYALPQTAPDLLDITRLPDLRTISSHPDHWFVPCRATWTDVLRSDLPALLHQAAAQVGGRQVQNTATLVGNLCNASPAADGVPCLMALGAQVELVSQSGRRLLELRDFILGPRRTARRADELVLGVRIPRGAAPIRSEFEKLGARRYLVISIASVAVVARAPSDLRIVVGACSAVPCRLPEVEAAVLAGKPLQIQHLAALSPIDDVRATADYRRTAVLQLIRRAYENIV